MEILPQLLLNAIIAGSIYALASSGLTLTYGLLRILNFAHGHIMMVGAYLFYDLFILRGAPMSVAGVGTAVLSVALAIVALEIFIVPFLRYHYFLPLVTSLALGTILESVISMAYGVNVKSLTTSFDIRSYELVVPYWPGNGATVYITPIQIVIITSAVVLLSGLAYLVHATGLGRQVRAFSEHAYAAESLGVAKRKLTGLVFAVGVFMACFAGVLVGFETNLQPTMGNAYTIKAFAAMILGGLGNIWGTILGAYILGLIENLSIGLDLGPYSLPAGYKDAFAFVIILLVLLVRPQGLFGSAGRQA